MSDTKNKNKTNYIEPAEFFDEVLKCIKREEASDKLARMFMLLSERRVNHRMFVRYVHIREDLIAIGAMACVIGYKEFRPIRNILEFDDDGELVSSTKVPWDGTMLKYNYQTCYNPFSFFSRCIENAILQYLKKEYKQSNIINKMKVMNEIDPDYGYLDMMADREDGESNEDNDHHEVVDNGEDTSENPSNTSTELASDVDEPKKSIIEW